MPEPEQTYFPPAPIPGQPDLKAPLQKRWPLVVVLAGIILLFGVSNLISLATGGKKSPTPRSAMPMRPATANPQQVTSFETQQELVAQRDAAERQRREQLAEQMRQLQAEEQATTPGPESNAAAPMTPAQRTALYGDHNPNAPQRVSGLTEAQAEAKQRRLAREKQHQDAVKSDTVAIDFAKSVATSAGNASSESEIRNAPVIPGTPTVGSASADSGNTPRAGDLSGRQPAPRPHGDGWCGLTVSARSRRCCPPPL